MTQKTPQTKNEGILSFLTAVIKKSVDIPEDVSVLAEGVRILSGEMRRLADNLSAVIRIVQKHDQVINVLLENQETIFKGMKTTIVDTTPEIRKTKSEKPN